MATKVIGLERLRRKLKALPDAVRKQMREDIAKGADEIVALQKSLAPHADGALRDSIAWTFGEPPPTSATGAFRPSKSVRSYFISAEDSIRATIYAGNDDAFYARWVEFGTAPHVNGGQFAGTTNPGTPAQPFFYPAYRTFRRKVKSRISRGVRKAARKVAAQ